MSGLPRGPLALAPGFRFQWENAQQAYVLLYPEGMVTLSPSAAEILRRCDGNSDADAIIADLKRQFPGVDLGADVRELLETALERGWIRAR
jgi:pyrroloquinoline quinone biosynthesis protein D